jgi:hypothetical protein
VDSEVIAGIGISMALFSLLTWIILRFTSSPGLRLWSFVAIVLLSYPIGLGFLLVFFRYGVTPDGQVNPVLSRVFIAALVVAAPTSAWLLIRAGIAAWLRPRRLFWATFGLGLVIAAVVYLRYTAVPWKTLDFPNWRAMHPTWGIGSDDDSDANRLSIFLRANIDYIVSPDARFERLTFYDFWRENSDLVYMRFLEPFPQGGSIIYCYSTREKRFLWKAWWPIHDS